MQEVKGKLYTKAKKYMKVVCINDSKKPAEVPASSWIEKGETYTVIHSANMAMQRMTVGYKLKEVSMPEDSEYEYYVASRFRPYTEDDAMADEAFEELMNEDLVLI